MTNSYRRHLIIASAEFAFLGDPLNLSYHSLSGLLREFMRKAEGADIYAGSGMDAEIRSL